MYAATDTDRYRDVDTPAWAAFLALPDEEQCARVLDTLAVIVDEVGDEYRLETELCRYVTPPSDVLGLRAPSCLAGRVCYRLGAGLDTLARWDEGPGGAVLWDSSIERVDHRIGPMTRHVLKAAQRKSDTWDSIEDARFTWGDVLASVYVSLLHYDPDRDDTEPEDRPPYPPDEKLEVEVPAAA